MQCFPNNLILLLELLLLIVHMVPRKEHAAVAQAASALFRSNKMFSSRSLQLYPHSTTSLLFGSLPLCNAQMLIATMLLHVHVHLWCSSLFVHYCDERANRMNHGCFLEVLWPAERVRWSTRGLLHAATLHV
jgi:hypothetical protein